MDESQKRLKDLESLTPQQRQVLRLLCQDKTNAEIAAALSVQTDTVEYHIGNICERLKVTAGSIPARRAALVRLYCEPLREFDAIGAESESATRGRPSPTREAPGSGAEPRVRRLGLGLRRARVLPLSIIAAVIGAIIIAGLILGPGAALNETLFGSALAENREAAPVISPPVALTATSPNVEAGQPARSVGQTPTPQRIPTTIAAPLATASPARLVTLPFEDGFQARPSEHWEPLRGTWRVIDGTYAADPTYAWQLSLVGDSTWVDYRIDVDVVNLDGGAVRVVVRAQDLGAFLAFQTSSTESLWITVRGADERSIAPGPRGAWPRGDERGTVHHLAVEVRGDIFTAYADGAKLIEVSDSSFRAGRAGLGVQSQQRFDNFRVTELR